MPAVYHMLLSQEPGS